MTKERRLSIQTKKNWPWAFYSTVVGLVFFFISISLVDYSGEIDWFANIIFFILFLAGVVLSLALPYVIFMKEKVLVFIMTPKYFKMVDSSDLEEKDFNKKIPLSGIKKFYHKKNIKWGGFSEVIDGLFYLDLNGKENLFLDLTLPDVKIEEESIEKIVYFVNAGY